MFKRVNIFKIISDHFLTLRKLDSESKYIYWKDLLLFIVFPLLIGVYLAYKGFSITPYIGNLIAAISIFGGFLFNLLAIIYSQIDKIKTDAEKEDNKLKKRFVKEIHVNISYAIVLSLIIVLLLIACSANFSEFKYDWFFVKILFGLTYFLLIKFLLTLLMVLNRVYLLLKKDSE